MTFKIYKYVNANTFHLVHNNMNGPLLHSAPLTCHGCRSTSVIDDHASGDSICSKCGLVLSEKNVEVTSEWRNFAQNGESQAKLSSRVGIVSDFFVDSALGTCCGATPPKTACTSSLSHKFTTVQRLSTTDKSKLKAARSIEDIVACMELPDLIMQRSKEIVNEIETKHHMHKSRFEAIGAVVVYIACREKGVPRTFKEFEATCDCARSKMVRSYKTISRILDTKPKLPTASQYLPRFCSRLGLTHADEKQALNIISRLKNTGDEHTSITMAACAVYEIVCSKPELDIARQEVSEATGVGVHTLRRLRFVTT